LFALLVAEKALQQYRGTTFERPLVSAFKKMAASLPDTVSLNIADWEQTISFRTRAEPILNLEIFDALSKAAGATHAIAVDSIASPASAPRNCAWSIRIIWPTSTANGFSSPGAICARTFGLLCPRASRRWNRPGGPFARPQKFSLEKRLRDSFGVQSGQGSFEVVIQFNELVADYIREKKWHESQVLRELKDGGLELRMKLSSLAEVERWVLGWAGNARVLQPPELAESIAQAARKILQI
jgi:predicted DNA-binding transcriptional regulator YafY